ncbi:hypothetical protein [Rhodopirellula sp. MGV]|uniref:hypothetical protein n=1 Tax=Rhodopirellula sp. MGV TaxID=2023130 RepID=UPI00117A1768|nr:hypothetical protein [Rhodopirellula sp. MGV]
MCAATRHTDRIFEDLCNSLVDAGKVDDAIWICQRQLQQNPDSTLAHARWIGRLSIVLAEKASASLYDSRASDLNETFQQALINTNQPIDRYLQANPGFHAQSFLIADRITASTRVLRTAILVASISSQTDPNDDTLLRAISRLEYEASGLERSAKECWTLANTTPKPEIESDQWQQLIRELAMQQVSLAIMQTELFDRGSNDFAAAAANATGVATETLRQLPDGVPAKRITRILLVESLLRSGDSREAERELGQLTDVNQPSDDLTLRALQVRIALNNKDVDEAERLVAAPTAATSIELDFAKLEMLLAKDESGEMASKWLATIEQHGGAFARRRAEALIVRHAKSIGGNDATANPKSMSPAVIAAQGEDWLRRGDYLRAANLLRDAASVSNAEAAIPYATKSAASAIKASEPRHAIDTLRLVAMKFPNEPTAFELMTQAALLAAKLPADKSSQTPFELLESLLTDITQTWPTHEKTPAIAEWLCKLYRQTDRDESAAEFTLQWLTLRPDAAASSLVEETWFEYLSGLDSETCTASIDRLNAVLSELTSASEENASPFIGVVSLLLDQPATFQFAEPDSQMGDDRFVWTLYKLRSGEAAKLQFDDVSADRVKRGRWRLERDIRIGAGDARSTAQALAQWPGATAVQSAIATFWNEGDDASINRLKDLAVDAATTNDQADDILRVLASSNSTAAKRAAAELAERRAASQKIRSYGWYQAKLNAIEWLQEAGEADEATKRASFLLLLHPPKDVALRQRLKQYTTAP